MDHISAYLKKPYPYYYTNLSKATLTLLLVLLFSFSFSYLFEPFEVNRDEHKLDYFWICLIHSSIPLVIGLPYFYVLNRIQNNDQKWTVGKEALQLSILLFIIGLGSFLVRDIIYDKPDNWSYRYFWEELRNTALVGILLLMLILPLNLERLLKKHRSSAKTLNLYPREKKESKTLCINSSISSESFTMLVSDFLYAKVDGNYSDLFIKTEATVSKKLVRISLKELETQFKDVPQVFKTHRSYMVNINHIQNVSGNAQGYLLDLGIPHSKIPVSRSRIASFNSIFSIEG